MKRKSFLFTSRISIQIVLSGRKTRSCDCKRLQGHTV
nr:MAG TPA: hypothetical protein [Caudoviricetes sp.]